MQDHKRFLLKKAMKTSKQQPTPLFTESVAVNEEKGN